MNFDMYSYLHHSARIIDKNFLHLAKVDKALSRRIGSLGLLLSAGQLCLLFVATIQDKQIRDLTAKVKELENDNVDLNMAIYGTPNSTKDKDEEM